MKIIIDAYNLFHFAKNHVEPPGSLTPTGLTKLVSAWGRRTGHEVLLVFDGRPPRGMDVKAVSDGGLQVRFVGPKMTADEAIIEMIDATSAPRRCVIVSNDRAIRRAAKRRRGKESSCEAFWAELVKMRDRRPGPREPKEKRSGLHAEQTAYWLKEFGLD